MTPDHADAWARGQLDRMEIAMQAHEQHDTDRFEESREAMSGIVLSLGLPKEGPSLGIRMDRLETNAAHVAGIAAAGRKGATWLLATILTGVLTLLWAQVSGCIARPPPTPPPSAPTHP